MSGTSTRGATELSLILLLSSVILFQAACGRGRQQGSRIPVGWADAPAPNATVGGAVPRRGWAADESGITSVCVYVDRMWVSCTEDISISRPDVAAAWLAMPGAGSSGWQMQLDAASLSPGQHHLLFQSASKDGVTRDVGSLSVSVSK